MKVGPYHALVCACVCVCSEAAFTLLLYWELLQWEERPLREFLHYPAQSEWQRKESLSRKVLHYFNKGKASGQAVNIHTHTHTHSPAGEECSGF